MATAIYIYSSKSWSALEGGRDLFEDDLDDFLGDGGGTTGGGGGTDGWNIDLEIHPDQDLEAWVQRLTDFLRDRGVPDDTHFTIHPAGQDKGESARTVYVHDTPRGGDNSTAIGPPA